MGGLGSGGLRPGSGPKVDDGPLPEVDEFDAPDDLTMDERRVWLELAPFAFQARTLNKASSYGFRMMCRNIVLELRLGSDPETAGGANHRGLIQRIDAELLRFSLAPVGKPMKVYGREAKPKNALETLQERRRIRAVK